MRGDTKTHLLPWAASEWHLKMRGFSNTLTSCSIQLPSSQNPVKVSGTCPCKWKAVWEGAPSTFLNLLEVLFFLNFTPEHWNPVSHLALRSCAILRVAGETAYISLLLHVWCFLFGGQIPLSHTFCSIKLESNVMFVERLVRGQASKKKCYE